MGQFSRTSRPPWATSPGPYIGIIRSHLDAEYMGSLEVEILKINEAGNDFELTGQYVPCSYLSPFYGVTPRRGVQANEGYDYTQKSYGFWAVPPDVGTKVMVIFAEGNWGYGYWIGCIQDKFMNFMLPGYASTRYNSLDIEKDVPVGEFNKRTETAEGRNPTQYIKPYDPDRYQSLLTRGLDRDYIRGTTTSSARREVPSHVFGWSTPGQYDRRPGKPTVPYGERFAQTNVGFSRLGGHSFVMDDGDASILRTTFASQGAPEYKNVEAGETGGNPAIPFNDLMRLQTRTGHQILLHNTEDLIYIGNARGTAWIELTSNGKIDIYSSDSISVRSGNDLNVTADRDINLSAGRDFNINAAQKFQMTAGNDMNLKAGTAGKIELGSELDIWTGSTTKIKSGGEFNVYATGDGKITVANLDVFANGASKHTSTGQYDLNVGNFVLTSGSEVNIQGPTAEIASAAAQAATAPDAAFPVRVPEHEPWAGHENLGPLTFSPANTEARTAPSENRRETSPLITRESDQRPTSQENVARSNVDGPQQVVPGQVGPIGEQPRQPVEINSMQRYFLHRLIQEIGLIYNVSANAQSPGNAEAIAMAMAQVQRECGFEPKSENLNYSASRLRAVFPTRVQSDAFAQELANAGPAAIGNTIYGNRYGNGPDEGYKFRGRGLIQLTFRENYERYGRLANRPEVIENPDLANDPEIATDLAIAYLKSKSVINWGSGDLNALGSQFESAVGYAKQGGQETATRIGIGRGFLQKLLDGELTPLESLDLEPAGTNTQEPTPDVPNTFRQSGPGPDDGTRTGPQ